MGYDDEAIARKKGEYVVANGLGGVMFWYENLSILSEFMLNFMVAKSTI